jgi:hypothetical protein
VGDTLIVQPDAERCAVVFRGSFQVASEEVLPALRAAVGVEVGDEPVPWPDLSEAPAGASSVTGVAAGESAKRTDWSSTVRLGEGDVVDAPVSVAGVGAEREPAREGAHPLEETFPLDDTLPPAGSERRPRDARTVPLPPVLPPAGGGARPREARTVPLPPVRVRGPGQDDAMSAPFPIAPAGTRGEREGGERPSTPWAASGTAAVPAIASRLEGTVDLSEPEAAPAPAPTSVEIATPAPAQAAAPAPVATPAPARASEPLPAPERDPQVERSPEPRAPAPAPSAPKRERPTLLGSLYKRFRKD